MFREESLSSLDLGIAQSKGQKFLWNESLKMLESLNHKIICVNSSYTLTIP